VYFDSQIFNLLIRVEYMKMSDNTSVMEEDTITAENRLHVFSIPLEETLKNEITHFCNDQSIHIFQLLSAGIKLLIYRYLDENKKDEAKLQYVFNNTLSGNINLSAEVEYELPVFIEPHITFYELLDSVGEEIHQKNTESLEAKYGRNITGRFACNILLSDERKANEELFALFTLNKGELVTIEFTCGSKAYLHTVFKRSTEHFSTLLKGIIYSGDSDVSLFPFIREEETTLIKGYSIGATDPVLVEPLCLHELFEQTVERNPDREALLSDQVRYSYSELNKKSNQLANHLIEQGVRTGDFIGLLFHKSPELYIGMLAILKAGAAYVPIDPGYPTDRIDFITKDCKARFLLTEKGFESKYNSISCAVITFNTDTFTFLDYTDENIPVKSIDVLPSSIAYAIYTSGSTGTPKGVLIPHQSISNLVRSEGKLFQIAPDDRVFQGFSVAFDASLEELWFAFYSGAALVFASDTVVKSGELLVKHLNTYQVTVWSTVPTLLSMIDEDIPSLRLLVVGGEVCPDGLVQKWHKPSRRIVNTYGPTEATVVATYADILPGHAITIGKPLINYSAYILDAYMQIQPIGVAGEICIGGASLAKGYINREESTLQKFVTVDSVFHVSDEKERLYKTGDLGRLDENGNIEFLGRIDSQVKLRGYRIELSEIEQQILKCADVKNATVLVKQSADGIQQLAAYVLTETKDTFKPEEIKKQIRLSLASYMVPAVFIPLQEFPMTTSGKIDKKALLQIEEPQATSREEIKLPQTEMEGRIHTVWQKHFKPNQVSVADNFFDLGGHSLLASIIISELRKQAGMEALSVQDIYAYPTIEKLAVFADSITKTSGATEGKKKQASVPLSRFEYHAVPALQLCIIGIFYLSVSFMILTPFRLRYILPDAEFYEMAIFGFLFFFFFAIPLSIAQSVLVKRVLIGKFKGGIYPLWGWYYLRFWIVKKYVDLVPLSLLSGTPFINYYYRWMGAKIGKNVYMGSDRLRMFDLISIGDDSSIAKEACLFGYRVENGNLIIGSIKVGNNCIIGTRSVLNEGVVMADNTVLEELSLLPPDLHIPENEKWGGSPARKVGSVLTADPTEHPPVSKKQYNRYVFRQVLALLGLQILPLLVSVPFIEILYRVYINSSIQWTVLAVIPTTVLYFISYFLTIAALKWIIVGKANKTEISIYSNYYIRKWMIDSLMYMTLLYFRAIYATLYISPWLRLLGAKIGRRAEVSTVNQITVDLLHIGSESFIADSVSIGLPTVSRGIMKLKATSVGSRTFIGNSAVLASGSGVGNNMLIGVLSVPPKHPDPEQLNNTSWLGSPAMFLPKRQIVGGFTEKETFNPPVHMVLLRGFIEFFKITLPYMISSALVLLLVYEVSSNIASFSFIDMWLYTCLMMIGISTTIIAITVCMKWILVGKYKPTQKPLWSTFVWRNELINSLTETMVYPFFVSTFLGTPYAASFFRLMGSKFGKRVYMDTTEITEFDLVHVGNNVALNFGATIQTHLFEDRIMKMSNLSIGDQCSVGCMSVVLYDSEMEQGSNLKDLSLLMKGESLPANSNWQGIPAQYVYDK